ncbi:MAG: LuxR C-terminal-related transcriptional regulator [Pseudonocardia sp.]|nr:LuxR C-terminal-related transcriptional regulator [Pseudonocardia sp.]
MIDEDTTSSEVDAVLHKRLLQLQQVSGLPVVFGGTTRRGATGQQLVISRLVGTMTDSLRGLVVHRGRGLGGAVVARGVPCRVNDYASTTAITHDYDRIVVDQERLTSIMALPVTVEGAVRGVLYAAVRDTQPLGDSALRNAGVVAAHLGRDLAALRTPPAPTRGVPSRGAPAGHPSAALHELARVIGSTADPELRERLTRIHRDLGGTTATVEPVPPAAALTPREIDTLRLVAVGASNVEIARQLGLSAQTVKAYLRAVMRKLDVRNRTAAVHAARNARIL